FDFGVAFALRLCDLGLQANYNGRTRLLSFPGMWTIRPRLLWPVSNEDGLSWHVRIDRKTDGADFDLLVRMEDRFRPKDYFVATSVDVAFRFPHWLNDRVSDD